MTKAKFNVAKKQFIQAFCRSKTPKETNEFLSDLLSRVELEEFTRRFLAARRLNEGRTYLEVSRETGLSSTTVARVSKCVQRKNSGYKLVLSRF